ncbi:MAG: ParB/RepB/Spo0J family partition protein [Bdellovibrionota bacterium]
MNPNSQKQPNRPALGKGLASLLPGAAANPTALARQIMGDMPAPPATNQAAASVPPAPVIAEGSLNRERIPGITMADVDQIVPNQYQPRRDFEDGALQELAESIRTHGIIQPLIVRRGEDGKLHLIAGERRLRASKIAGLKQVPIVLRKTSDKEKLELALIENIQREDLNCVEIALSYFQLSEDFRLTQEEVAKRVGKDRVSVANHLRLLKLPEAILDDLRKGALTFGHGRALLSVTDPVKRMDLRNRIVEKNLSVRETERMVAEAILDAAEQQGTQEKPENPVKAELKEFSDRLGRALGTRVKTKGDKYRGSIVIDYFSKEDLDRISLQLLR